VVPPLPPRRVHGRRCRSSHTRAGALGFHHPLPPLHLPGGGFGLWGGRRRRKRRRKDRSGRSGSGRRASAGKQSRQAGRPLLGTRGVWDGACQ
jgi:hypothetical protein